MGFKFYNKNKPAWCSFIGALPRSHMKDSETEVRKNMPNKIIYVANTFSCL